MKISFISWDNSFRNFYTSYENIIKYCDFDYEIIHIEQQDQKSTEAIHRNNGTQNVASILKEAFSHKIIYLEQEVYSIPSMLKAGLYNVDVSSEYVAIIDCDQCFSKEFFENMKHYRKTSNYLNIHRIMMHEPLGVSKKNWLQGARSFESFKLTPKQYKEVSKPIAVNKLPLILFPREYVNIVRESLPNNQLWDGSATLVGLLICEILKRQGLKNTLSKAFTIHPWHPSGQAKKIVSISLKIMFQELLIKLIKNPKKLEKFSQHCYTIVDASKTLDKYQLLGKVTFTFRKIVRILLYSEYRYYI